MESKIFCGIACLTIFCILFPKVSKAADHPRLRTFSFTYITEVEDIPKDTRKISIWLPYPKSDANQKITRLLISAPYPASIYKEGEYGNYILCLSVADPEYRSIKVKMRFRVRRREYVRSDFDRVHVRFRNNSNLMFQRWLQPDDLVPLDDRIKKLALEVIRGITTDLDKARAIYDYAINNMAYDKSGTGWGRGDIYYACDTKRGNCTDFHAIFIGFCRAVGIPAKFAIGFSLPEERGQGEIAGYHCWAEFYLPGYGWVPVDVSEAYKNPAKKAYFFGAHDENRMQFTIGRDITLNPLQSGRHLNYFIYPYVEVDGKSFPRVQNKFLYRDLAMKTARGRTP